MKSLKAILLCRVAIGVICAFFFCILFFQSRKKILSIYSCATSLGTVLRYKDLATTPRGGENMVLPSSVVSALHLLRNNQVNDFRIEGTFLGNNLLRQRLEESAWPIRFNSRSKFVICFDEDLDITRFKLIGSFGGVAIGILAD